MIAYFLSFTPPCYKRELVKTLIDRTFKISNMQLGFQKDIQNLFDILHKKLYPEHALDMLLHRYITKAVEGNNTRPSTGVKEQELPRHCFKIPYIGYFLAVAQQRMCKLINHFCKLMDITIVYFTFKIILLRIYSTGKILSLIGFICASSTNFPLQAAVLFMLAKHANTFPCACTSTCHQTDHLTFTSTYRLQSLVAPPVT